MATIMLTEDNLIYRELLRELLELEGHEVLESNSAEEALLSLRHFNEGDVQLRRRRIDLFISDFNMGGMNGYEFIQEMRGIEGMRDVPVVMISSTTKDFKDLLKLEDIVFLSKPCPNSTVVGTVRKLLAASAAKRGEPPPSSSAPRRQESSSPVARTMGATFPTHASAPPPQQRPPGASIPAFPSAPPSAKPPLFPMNPSQPPVRPRPAPAPGMSLPAAPFSAKAAVPSKPAPAKPPVVPPAPIPPAPNTGKPNSLPPPSRFASIPPPSAAGKPPAAAPVPPTPSEAFEAPLENPRPPSRVDFSSIDDGLRNSISNSPELTEFLINRQKSTSEIQESSIQANSPVADLIEKILDGAVRRGASDIHIEPQLGSVEVRARVDGVLQRLVSLPSSVAENMAARIKILCGLNITEKRLPQDGQFAWRGTEGVGGKFRVSTLPALHGEKLVLRVLPSGNLGIKLDALGFTAEEMSRVRGILRSPNGLLLATGPTGSGKTTTLYTLLDSMNSRERNIVTVEDPIEYQLPGITQVQVNAVIGYTFERVLRSFLRQDPNVMLVGEIRDAETADIALKAAVTGHIVLSTLHTNDAVGAVGRLLSMGLPAYLVAAAVRLVIAQRLVRKLCPSCRQPGALTPEESCLLAPEEAAFVKKVWRPMGCATCHGIGYSGRRPVYELLTVMSDTMRTAISKGATPAELQAIAVSEGMVPMRRKALQYVSEGATSIEEALAVLFV